VLEFLPTFGIDRTEVTRGAFATYGAMEPLTGDGAAVIAYVAADRPGGERLPVVAINFDTARNYCRFLGKALPTTAEWQKAFRGGVRIGDGNNPDPRRNTPWLQARTPHPAKLKGADEFLMPAPVGAFPEDTSPYGVVDLAGNVSEWSASPAAAARLQGLRTVLGANWATPVELGHHRVTWQNSRPDRYLDFGIGFRCVTRP